jgi:hypothetical protein
MWDPQHITNLQTSTASYGDSFTFLYGDDVRTSQETRLWPSTTCYGDSFTFLYVHDVRTAEDTHLGPPRPVMGIDLLFCM